MIKLVEYLRAHKRGILSRTNIIEYVNQCRYFNYTQYQAFHIARAYLRGVITEREMRKALQQADGAYFGNPRAFDEFVQLCCLKP